MATNETVKHLVFENNHQTYNLKADMVKLEVIQGTVAHLIERIDEITHKKWHEDRAMAALSILELRDTVRLIDMAFYPLFQSMNEGVKNLETQSSELFDVFVKQSEKEEN